MKAWVASCIKSRVFVFRCQAWRLNLHLSNLTTKNEKIPRRNTTSYEIMVTILIQSQCPPLTGGKFMELNCNIEALHLSETYLMTYSVTSELRNECFTVTSFPTITKWFSIVVGWTPINVAASKGKGKCKSRCGMSWIISDLGGYYSPLKIRR